MQCTMLISVVCLGAGLAVLPAAAHTGACAALAPTAVTNAAEMRQEANQIFDRVETDARRVQAAAATLQAYTREPGVTWETHAVELDKVHDAVNDLGQNLCRLETMRNVVEPWQRTTIDRIARGTRLMADNAEDAIVFLNGHENDLWMPAYKLYASNLYDEANNMATSTRSAIEYAHVRREYRDLRHDVTSPSESAGGGE